MYLNAAKCWQGNETFLVWQVAVSPKGEGVPKKLYLVALAGQKEPQVNLVFTKPSNLKPQDALINILRKYAKTSNIRDIHINKNNKDIWISLYHGGKETPDYFVQVANTRPTEIRFIDFHNRSILVSKSSKATRTKVTQFDNQWPLDSPGEFQPILASLVEAALKSQAVDAQDESTQVEEPLRLGLQVRQNTEMKRKLKRRLKTLKKSLAMWEEKTPSIKQIKSTRKRADLIKSFAYMIKPDSSELVLEKQITGEEQDLVIELDPDLSPGANMDRMYSSVKRMMKQHESGTIQVKRTKKAIFEVEEAIKQLDEHPTQELSIDRGSLTMIKGDLGAAAQKSRPIPGQTYPPYCYVFQDEDEVLYFVGKSAKESDILTKTARSNDYWLHVIGSTGSHVIVRRASLKNKDRLPDSVARKAGILSIHYSKLRQDLQAEVHVTEKRFVKKKKGMAPGLWAVERSDTLFIKFSEEERQAVLNLKVNP